MSKIHKLDGILNPIPEQLASGKIGDIVYFDVIEAPYSDPDVQRRRLEDLAATTWLSDLKRGRARFLLLPGPDGEPTGAPLSTTSPEFREWLVDQYHRTYFESLDPEILESFTTGFDFQLRVFEGRTQKRR